MTTYLWIQDLGAEGGTLGAPPPFRVRGGACAAIATMAALEEPSILVNSPLKRLGAAVVTPSPVKVPRQAAPDPSPEPRQPSAASPDPRTKSPRDMRYDQRVFRQDAASVQSCLRFDRREAPLVSPAARAPAAASSSRTPTATCAKSPRSSTKKKSSGRRPGRGRSSACSIASSPPLLLSSTTEYTSIPPPSPLPSGVQLVLPLVVRGRISDACRCQFGLMVRPH